jgi:hypothetical protein
LRLGTRQEEVKKVGREVVDGRARAGRRVEGARAQASGAFEVFHEARVDRAGQVGDVGDALPDELGTRLANQRQHSRVAARVVSTAHEDQAHSAAPGRLIELALGGRDPRRVGRAVVVAEETQVDVRLGDFLQVYVVSAAVRGGQILEEKDVEEAPQEGVAKYEVTHRPTLGDKLPLHAADEDPLGHMALSIVRSRAGCAPPYPISQAKERAAKKSRLIR